MSSEFVWKPERHDGYKEGFRRGVLAFLLSLKRIQNQTGTNIPKFVKFEVIKRIQYFSSALSNSSSPENPSKENSVCSLF